jgi:elongation factor 3
MLPEIVPHISECIWNIRQEVNQSANETMLALCKVIGNPDVESVLPVVVGCIGDPARVPDSVEKVAETTFVKAVGPSLLSVMVCASMFNEKMPLLGRGLAERANICKRRCAIIIDNMCRLVPEAKDIIPFLPNVVPGLNRIVEIGGDPEMIAMCARALITLYRVSGQEIPEGLHETSNYDSSKPKVSSLTHSTTKRDLKKMEEVNTKLEVIQLRKETREKELDMLIDENKESADAMNAIVVHKISNDAVLKMFTNEIQALESKIELKGTFIMASLDFCVQVAEVLIDRDELNPDVWEDEYFLPYLGNFLKDDDSKAVGRRVLEKVLKFLGRDQEEEVEEGVEYLTNCEFSLGYGAMVLLRKARMKLKRGSRYGICGANGCGMC